MASEVCAAHILVKGEGKAKELLEKIKSVQAGDAAFGVPFRQTGRPSSGGSGEAAWSVSSRRRPSMGKKAQ